jgi:hypothetical protein
VQQGINLVNYAIEPRGWPTGVSLVLIGGHAADARGPPSARAQRSRPGRVGRCLEPLAESESFLLILSGLQRSHYGKNGT